LILTEILEVSFDVKVVLVYAHHKHKYNCWYWEWNLCFFERTSV